MRIAKQIVLIIFLSLSILTKAQVCSDIQNNQSDYAWQILKLSQFDRYFLLSAGSLSIVVLIMGVISWISYPSFSTPSDILFAITISQFIQNTALLTQASYFSYSDYQQQKPANFDTSCFWMGLISILGNVSSIYYNLIFCIILSYSIQNTLKGTFFNQFRYHIVSLFINVGYILILVFTQGFGRGLNGVCGYRITSNSATGRFIIQIIISSICIYSMVKFKTKLPTNQYFTKQLVFKFYFYYMGVFCFTQIVSSIFFLVGDILCKTNVNQILKTLHIFYSISVVLSIILSFFLTIVRFSHPTIWKRIVKKFKTKVNKINQSQKRIEEQDQQSALWLGGLLQSIKGSQLLSFFQGISISIIERQKTSKNRQLTSYEFAKIYKCQINEQIVQNFISRRISHRQSLLVKTKLGGLVALPYQITSYCPQVFTQICQKNQLRLIIESLNIKKNINIVKKQSNINGGKSGQLFFSSYDHNLVFKTISQEQVNSYLSKLKDFYNYHKKQKQSLIVKILGVFSFKRKDINEDPIFLIMMNNITMNSRQKNVRVYDIKGSQFNRSTIEDNKIVIEEQQSAQKLRKFTLKDKDFKKLEESKIKINFGYANQLKIALRKDIQFLGGLGFMDYSLLIIKRQGQQSTKKRGLSQIKSSQEKNIIYNFGIIDYLQSWNIKRQAQRAIKTLITNQQVTANSPINYSNRLIQFIEQIL